MELLISILACSQQSFTRFERYDKDGDDDEEDQLVHCKYSLNILFPFGFGAKHSFSVSRQFLVLLAHVSFVFRWVAKKEKEKEKKKKKKKKKQSEDSSPYS